MRRLAPRPIGATLRDVVERSAPPTPIAAVQRRWRAAVGEAVADEATPVGERDGIVTVDCRSAVWAEELTLLAPELLARLNAELSEAGAGARVRRFSFVTRGRGEAG